MSPLKKSRKLHFKKKTPKKRESNENLELSGNTDALRDLLKRKWKVFRVSPLCNFSVNNFRFYEKVLNEGMSSKKKITDTYKSKFTLIENLKLNEQCAEGIKVEVIRNDSQRKYTGHFTSWSAAQDVTNDPLTFPILLVDAKEDDIHRVHSIFCKIFDCDIQPVTISLYALIAFFVKLLGTTRNSSDLAWPEHVIMEYKVPNCEAKDRIKISLCLEETMVVFAVVMDSLHKTYQGITSKEVIWEFYNKILNHIFHVYKMDLILAELHKITFPDAFITADGQVKMTNIEAAVSTLDVLGEFTPLDAVTNS